MGMFAATIISARRLCAQVVSASHLVVHRTATRAPRVVQTPTVVLRSALALIVSRPRVPHHVCKAPCAASTGIAHLVCASITSAGPRAVPRIATRAHPAVPTATVDRASVPPAYVNRLCAPRIARGDRLAVAMAIAGLGPAAVITPACRTRCTLVRTRSGSDQVVLVQTPGLGLEDGGATVALGGKSRWHWRVRTGLQTLQLECPYHGRQRVGLAR